MRKLITLLLLLAAIMIQAQQHGRRPGNMPKVGSITGKIINSESVNPVEYANVVLYSAKDSSMVNGTITKQDGNFILDKLPFGEFYLEANFIGFNKKTLSKIKIKPTNKEVSIGTISLSPATQMLEAVEVKAEKQNIEYMIDKKVVNVSKDLNSAGGTAVDVLENTPSVQTDIDGNVSLRGSSNFKVLIDGKPSVLEGSDALQQIPSNAIDKIEIITNPSAKYDPEGVGGIINVIMKKNQNSGVNGIIDLSVGTGDKYSGNLLLNYKMGKFNIFGGVDYMDRTYYGENNSFSKRMGSDTTLFQKIDADRNFHRSGYKAKAGFDYNLDDKNTISLSGEYGERKFGMNFDAETHEYDKYSRDDFSIKENEFEITGNYFSTNLFYEHKFNDKGHKLSGSANYSQWSPNEENKLDKYITNSNYEIIDNSPYRERSEEVGDRTDLRFKVDYEKPISQNSKLEAGYYGRTRGRLADYQKENYNNLNGEWIVADSLTNETDYSHLIQAIYGLYSNNIWGFDYQLGIRGEYTDRLIEQKVTEQKYAVERLDYFPTVHLSKDLPFKQQVQASYSRRIRRPRGWYLDPYPTYLDELNYRVGNPSLEPEFIDSYELNYMKRFKQSFATIEGYYRQKNNRIERVTMLEENNVAKHTFANINKDYTIGVEFMGNLTLTKWWNFTASANLYNYNIVGGGEITANEEETKTTNTWDGRINNTLKFKTGTRLQLQGFYMAPSITSQGNREGFFVTSVAARQDLMKKKLSITLRARDILQTMKHEFVIDQPYIYTENEFTREAPVFMISLSYKINNYKNHKNKRNGSEEMEFEGEGMY